MNIMNPAFKSVCISCHTLPNLKALGDLVGFKESLLVLFCINHAHSMPFENPIRIFPKETPAKLVTLHLDPYYYEVNFGWSKIATINGEQFKNSLFRLTTHDLIMYCIDRGVTLLLEHAKNPQTLPHIKKLLAEYEVIRKQEYEALYK